MGGPRGARALRPPRAAAPWAPRGVLIAARKLGGWFVVVCLVGRVGCGGLGSSGVGRQAENLKAAGSNPAPGTHPQPKRCVGRRARPPALLLALIVLLYYCVRRRTDRHPEAPNLLTVRYGARRQKLGLTLTTVFYIAAPATGVVGMGYFLGHRAGLPPSGVGGGLFYRPEVGVGSGWPRFYSIVWRGGVLITRL